MKRLTPILLLLILTFSGCGKGDSNTSTPSTSDPNTLLINNTVLTQSYLGNGPQWGGYDIVESWTGNTSLSENDWNTLFKRVSFMRPSLMRIMVSQGWNYMNGNTFYPQKSDPILGRILTYCQQHGITVQLGEWGHVGGSSVDATWIDNATNFLSYLVKDKGYSCIKYYTIVNEPNGSWSTTAGNYSLWKNIIQQFYKKLEEKSLTDKVKIMGPDVAVWSISETPWVINTRNELGNEVKAFDIHSYPTNEDVYSTTFLQLLKAFKAASNTDEPITLGELGFKYSSTSSLGMTNTSRIKADPYAADDSQMHVYDSFYAIDMADATIQAMLASFEGVTYWDMDDAMYNDDGGSSTKLKRWGFWNILGSEKFNNPNDENIRPWFYTISLLCRYFPAGTTIYDVTLPKPVKSGLRAIAGIKDGKTTIAIVNSSTNSYTFNLMMKSGVILNNTKTYFYQSQQDANYIGKIDANGFASPSNTGETIDFSQNKQKEINLPGQSFMLLTNMD
jgi:hypothetical protein